MWDEVAKAFVFKIGDIVRHKTASKVTNGDGDKAPIFCVAERLIIETSAGLERSYVCGAVLFDHYHREKAAAWCVELREVEIELAPDPRQ